MVAFILIGYLLGRLLWAMLVITFWVCAAALALAVFVFLALAGLTAKGIQRARTS